MVTSFGSITVTAGRKKVKKKRKVQGCPCLREFLNGSRLLTPPSLETRKREISFLGKERNRITKCFKSTAGD